MTKITIDKAVIEQALEALKTAHYKMIDAGMLNQAILNKNFTAHEALRDSLRQAMEQPTQQEPADDKALTLATWLQANYEADEIDEAAGELRRLYGENRMLWKEREEPHRQLEFYVRECNRLESERDSALLVQSAQQEPVAHFGSAYVNENGVHVTTVLGPVAIPQDAKLYTAPPPKAEPQEPVAWMYDWLPPGGPTAFDWISGNKAEVFAPENGYFNIRPLYTAPPPAVIDKSAAVRIATALGWEPKKEWQELTTEDRVEILRAKGEAAVMLLTEAKLKEKNT